MREVDVVVIGGGPAGEVAAEYAARGRDATAVIVESELLGGECSYYACIPSKALLRPLDVAAAAAHLGGITDVRVVREELLARRDEWVSGYDDTAQVDWAETAGLEVVRGRGRLVGERTVEVTTTDGSREQLVARDAVVLATGGIPVVPDPFADLRAWGSRDVTGVREVPDSLVIIGGGPVACEAARWMVALGSAVTMLVRDDRLLARAEPFAGEIVADSLRAAGVDLRLGTSASRAERQEARDTGLGRVHGGPVSLSLGEETVVASELLLATGRRPALGDLGLDALGLEPDDLSGDGSERQQPPWLYVVGDASGEVPLTHWGKYEARRVGDAIRESATGEPSHPAPQRGPVPQVVYTDPQVAWVGPTADQARAAGQRVRTLDADYASATGVALLRDDAGGQARLVVHEADDVLVGASFVGPEAAELLHSATVAIAGRLTLTTLRQAVPAFPTASEIWLQLLEQ